MEIVVEKTAISSATSFTFSDSGYNSATYGEFSSNFDFQSHTHW